jgi:hypothetical protein
MLTIRYPNEGIRAYTPNYVTTYLPFIDFAPYTIIGDSFRTQKIGGYLAGETGQSHPHPVNHIELYGTATCLSGCRRVNPAEKVRNWNTVTSQCGWTREQWLSFANRFEWYYYTGRGYNGQWGQSLNILIPFGTEWGFDAPEWRLYNVYPVRNHSVRIRVEAGEVTSDGVIKELYVYSRGTRDVFDPSGTRIIQHDEWNNMEKPAVWKNQGYYCQVDFHADVPSNMKSGKWTTNDFYGSWLCSKITGHHSAVPANDLVTDCIKDLKQLDINTVTAVQGLVNCWKDIKSLIASANGHVSAKWLTSVYLQMKYGFSNTVRDAIDIMKYLREESKRLLSKYSNRQITHASGGMQIPYDGVGFYFLDGYEVTTLTVCCSTMDHGLAQVCRAAMDIDVFPELGNIWDVIPFSFVVDWFVPFGDLFDAIDANTYKSTLSVHYCTISQNYVFHGANVGEWLPNLGGTFQGTADVRLYSRQVTHSIPSPSLELHTPTGFTQWIPAGALIAQGAMK